MDNADEDDSDEIISDHSDDLSDHDDTFVGGILCSRTADSVPRGRISRFTYISFTDHSAFAYSAFQSFDPWLKSVLNVYYEVIFVTFFFV